jgi:hypothetical protein
MLRRKLREMIAVTDAYRHPSMLRRLSRIHRNSIRLLPSSHPIYRYTCLMHVFRFTEHPDYIPIAQHGSGRVFAGAEFAHWLISRGMLTPLRPEDARAGDLVFYFRDRRFTHAGMLTDKGRVVSKWGTGQLYEHELYEVPDTYGDEVRYFASLSCESAFEYFTWYAAELGIPRALLQAGRQGVKAPQVPVAAVAQPD